MPLETTAYVYQHRVTYSECTVGNHIYYSRYLDILEAARGEFFRQLGCTLRQWQEADTLFPVIETRQKYFSPARYDDVLRIEIRITMAKGVRLNFAYRILKEAGQLVLEAETFHACTTQQEKPQRLPPDLLQMLSPDLQAPGAKGAAREDAC